MLILKNIFEFIFLQTNKDYEESYQSTIIVDKQSLRLYFK